MSRLTATTLIFFFSLALIITFYHQRPGMVSKPNQAATTMAGSRITVVQKYTVSSLNPADAADTGSARVITNVFEGLTRFKPGTALVEPCLASSWEVSGDGLTWTFNLRKNVNFHDGTHFDANAVQANFKEIMKQSTDEATTYADLIAAPLDNVEVVDNYRVKLHLKYPYAPMINNLAMPMGASMISPESIKKLEQGSQATPAGTGPFIPAGQIGGGILLKANKNYWDTVPKAGEILFLTEQDLNKRTQMLLEGRADIALDLDFKKTADLKLQGYPVFRATGLDMCYLGFYTDKKPFNRTQLRNAVALTINRKTIFNELWFNEVRPALAPLPPTVPGFNAPGDAMDYDPQKAVNLLKGAGYENGMSFTLVAFTDQRPYCPEGGKVLAEKIAQSLAEAKIEVKIIAYPWEDFKRALVRREGDAFLFGWTSDNGDPDNFLYTLLAGSQIEGGMNITNYRNPQLDTLLDSARNTTDQEIRRELYGRAMETIARDSPLIALDHSQYHASASPKISGFVLSPTGWDSFYGIAINNAKQAKTVK
ncbi:peptide/nickel transport system substrate-binding protein [Desulfotomaculum arcticum]|uniref:Peptide/nickel transport system substrate-binding protein n=1 Tax=Desulfotruncus arcticus DSM 17038 TaxID=1121424 RepID=A0A1I2ZNK9_9FIRM|nr:ABC transporter substrate-binding protein [Desulfotruncus arcticus]SFH39423.1 peptide/nickel transport system substrate-binding protein [Desulfotomaculum arcticum] [Desulfotruncus arcticus DSM 17038]